MSKTNTFDFQHSHNFVTRQNTLSMCTIHFSAHYLA